jgi:hypothetical protein
MISDSSVKDEPITLDEAFNKAGGFGKVYNNKMDNRKIPSFNDNIYLNGVLFRKSFDIWHSLINIATSISL